MSVRLLYINIAKAIMIDIFLSKELRGLGVQNYFENETVAVATLQGYYELYQACR